MAVEIELWQWTLEEAQGDATLLSADETKRAAGFIFARDKARYIAGRAGVRRYLGQALGIAPEEIIFAYGPNGRPEVEGLSFNLSHTGNLAVLAVIPGTQLPLGVDIEMQRTVEPGLPRRYFAPSEVRAYYALPAADRQAAFFRCWTRKEAYVKATGVGLSGDLSSFTVSLDRDTARFVHTDGDDVSAWTLIDFSPGAGVAGALAVRLPQGIAQLRYRQGWPL